MKSIFLIEKELREKEKFSKLSLAKSMFEEGYELNEIFKYLNNNVNTNLTYVLRIFIKSISNISNDVIIKNMIKANINLKIIVLTLDNDLPVNFLNNIKDKNKKKEIIKALIFKNPQGLTNEIIHDIINIYKETDVNLIIDSCLEYNNELSSSDKQNVTSIFNIILNNLPYSKIVETVNYILNLTDKNAIYVINELTSTVVYPFLCSRYSNEEIIDFFKEVGYIGEDGLFEASDFIKEIEEERLKLASSKKKTITNNI